MKNFKHFAVLIAFFSVSWQNNFAQTSRCFDFECSSNCLIENNDVSNVETFYGRPKIIDACGGKKLRLNYLSCVGGSYIGGDGVFLKFPFIAGKSYKITYKVYKQGSGPGQSLGTALDFDLDWLLMKDNNYIKTPGSYLDDWSLYCGYPNYILRPIGSNMELMNRLTATYIPWWNTWDTDDGIPVTGIGNYCSNQKEFTYTPSSSGDRIFLRLDMHGWPYPSDYGSAEVYLDDICIEEVCLQQEMSIITESFEGFNNGVGQINPFENGYNCWKPAHSSQSPELFSLYNTSFWKVKPNETGLLTDLPAAQDGNNYVSAALWGQRGVTAGSTSDPCENSEQLFYSGCKFKKDITYSITFSLRIYAVEQFQTFTDPNTQITTTTGNLRPLEVTNIFSRPKPIIEWRLNNSMIMPLSNCEGFPTTGSNYTDPTPNGQLIWSLDYDLGTRIFNTNIKHGEWVRYKILFTPTEDYQNLWFMPIAGNLWQYLVHLDNIVIATDCNGYHATVCTNCTSSYSVSNTALSTNKKELNQNKSMNINDLNVYPNPLTDQSTIQYNLSKADRISIYLTDISGKIVKQLVTNKEHEAGVYEILMSKENTSSGMYFIVMDGTLGKNVKKLIVD